MTRIIRTTAGLILLGAALSACFGGGGGKKMTATVTPPAAPFEDQFGGAFGTDFRANPNTEPANVAAGDIGAENATAEPQTLPGT